MPPAPATGRRRPWTFTDTGTGSRRHGDRRDRRRRDHSLTLKTGGLRLHHRHGHQEVPGHAAGARRRPGRTTSASTCRSRCPTRRPSPNADYYVIAARPAPGADELQPAARGRCCASTCSSRPANVPGQARRAHERPARRHVDAGPDAGRLAGLRGRRPALPRAGDRRPRRTSRSGSCSTTCCRPAPTATCSCPTDSTLMGSGMGPMTMAAPGGSGHRHGRRPQPDCTEYPKGARLLQGQPGHAAPARRHHPLDQRRDAAPVDHPGQ